MNNELKLFENREFGNVRTIETYDGKVMFCGKDVATALGYKDTINAIKSHCKGVSKYHLPHPQSQDKTIEMSFIPESDVYRLAFGSKLPNAERFTDWIVEDVIPSIRQTGSYNIKDSYLIEDPAERAERWALEYRERKALETKVERLETKIEEDAPMVAFAKAIADSDELLTVGEFACIVNQAMSLTFNGISFGRNQMFELLRDNGYLINQKSMKNAPSSRMSKNDFMRIVRVYNDKDRRYNQETRITHSGAMFIFKTLRHKFKRDNTRSFARLF